MIENKNNQVDSYSDNCHNGNVGINQQGEKGFWNMDKQIERIFNRQFERMKNELVAINMPSGYLTIISKYWDFAKQDIDERIRENGKIYQDSRKCV